MGTARVVERLAQTYSAGEYPAHGRRGVDVAFRASFRGGPTWRIRACALCLALIRRYTQGLCGDMVWARDCPGLGVFISRIQRFGESAKSENDDLGDH